MKLKSKQLTLSSANPTKQSDTLKQFVGSSRTIKPQIKDEDKRFSFSRTDIKPCPQLLSSFHLPLLRKHSYSIKPFRGSCFFLVTLYIIRFFFPQLNLRQLILRDLGSRFIVMSQLGIQSGSSPSAGLQVVTQSNQQSKYCYSQLVSNPHCSEICPPKQLDYRCMPPHPPSLVSAETAHGTILTLKLRFVVIITSLIVFHFLYFLTPVSDSQCCCYRYLEHCCQQR